MNAIDIIVGLILLLAVWNGWRQGFIVQICSLAGIVAGIWLASRYGEAVGVWMKTDPTICIPAGFVVVLLAVVLAVSVAARVVRKLFHFAGFGIPDSLLGVVVAVVKYLLLLGALFGAFDRMNADYTLVEPRTVEGSKLYKPLIRISDAVFPFLEWVGERVPSQEDTKEK